MWFAYENTMELTQTFGRPPSFASQDQSQNVPLNLAVVTRFDTNRHSGGLMVLLYPGNRWGMKMGFQWDLLCHSCCCYYYYFIIVTLLLLLYYHYLSGWWFGTWILWLSIQLGMSSSQLTSIFFRGVGYHQPVMVIEWNLMGWNGE